MSATMPDGCGIHEFDQPVGDLLDRDRLVGDVEREHDRQLRCSRRNIAMKSWNWVARRIVYGMPERSMIRSLSSLAR